MGDALAALREALGLDQIAAEIHAITERLEQGASGPAWFTLRAACEAKGACYNSVKSRPDLQPCSGRSDGTIAGRKVWARTTVEKWIGQLDQSARSHPKRRRQ
jgi:hypothetical protein